MKRMSAAKAKIMEAARKRLDDRYDLGDKPVSGCDHVARQGRQGGARVKLADGWTWEKLAALDPDEVRAKDVYPAGFLPLPHPNHPEGGMLFPQFHIDELKENRRVATSRGSTSTFGHPRPLPPRVPARDLPHDADRPR